MSLTETVYISKLRAQDNNGLVWKSWEKKKLKEGRGVSLAVMGQQLWKSLRAKCFKKSNNSESTLPIWIPFQVCLSSWAVGPVTPVNISGLSLGYGVYTWPSRDQRKPHSAWLRSRTEPSLHSIYHWATCAFHLSLSQACSPFITKPSLQSIYRWAKPAFHLSLSQPCVPFIAEPSLPSIYRWAKFAFHLSPSQACVPIIVEPNLHSIYHRAKLAFHLLLSQVCLPFIAEPSLRSIYRHLPSRTQSCGHECSRQMMCLEWWWC